MKIIFFRTGLAGTVAISLLLLASSIVLAQTDERSVSQPTAGRTEAPPPADNRTTTIPPANFSGREGNPPPPPNNFREPQSGQFSEQEQGFHSQPKEQFQQGRPGQSAGEFQKGNDRVYTAPPKPSMTQSGDMQDRTQKERMMNGNFQGQFGERQGASNSAKSFEGGPGGASGQGNSGDYEARQQKMEEEQQKREQEQAGRQGARMAKMLQQTVTALNKRAAKLQSAGLPLTSDCKDVVTTLTDAIAKAKNATSMDDLQDVNDAMQSMDDVNHCRMVIERLLVAPKLFKTANAFLKNLKKRKIDAAEVERKLNELTNEFNTLKSSTPSNDDVDSFFDSMDELKQSMQQLMQPPKETSDQSGSAFNSIKSLFGF